MEIETTKKPDYAFITDLVHEIITNSLTNPQLYKEFIMEIEKIEANGNETSDTSMSEDLVPLENILDDEEEDDNIDPQEKFRTKNEEILNPNSINIEESPEERMARFHYTKCDNQLLKPAGKIQSIIDKTLVIQSNPNLILDLDNILLLEDQIVLGKIDDVIGNVKAPHYTVVYDLYLKKLNITIGSQVYLNPTCAKLILPMQIKNLMMQKGCDASNRFDEELADVDEVEFSDDEKEEAFKKLKQQKKAKQKTSSNTKDSNNNNNTAQDDQKKHPKDSKKGQNFNQSPYKKVHENPQGNNLELLFPLKGGYLQNYLAQPQPAFGNLNLMGMTPYPYAGHYMNNTNNSGGMMNQSSYSAEFNQGMMNPLMHPSGMGYQGISPMNPYNPNVGMNNEPLMFNPSANNTYFNNTYKKQAT